MIEKKPLKISKNTRKLWEKRFVEILTRREAKDKNEIVAFQKRETKWWNHFEE